jgi:glutamate dehydrogenase/leucine dehydrogenase
MDIFKSMTTYAHEQFMLCHEPCCGYFGIIAIHDTTLGPALGALGSGSMSRRRMPSPMRSGWGAA